MISIIEHIEYLIVRHDCVIVPGIGALIAHHTPARIDMELGCIFPPKRTVAFNPALTHNDGLLTASVARRHSLSYDRAAEVVADNTSAMLAQLDSDGETGLGHIGVLSRGQEGELCFEPFDGLKLSHRYALLSATPARRPAPTQESAPASVPATTLSDDEVRAYLGLSSTPRRVLRSTMRVAAILAIVVMMGLTLTTPLIDDHAVRASMAPRIVTPEVDPAVDALAFADRQSAQQLSIALPDSATATATVAPSAFDALRRNPADRYFVVVASFPTRTQAFDFVATAGDSRHLAILSDDSRHRVYAATGTTLEQARRPLADHDFMKAYPQAWILRR